MSNLARSRYKAIVAVAVGFKAVVAKRQAAALVTVVAVSLYVLVELVLAVSAVE